MKTAFYGRGRQTIPPPSFVNVGVVFYSYLQLNKELLIMDGGNMDKIVNTVENTNLISELLKMLANPKPKAERLYNVMDGLGIAYKRTSCIKCLRDYVAICLEELRAIASAADISGFDDNEIKQTEL